MPLSPPGARTGSSYVPYCAPAPGPGPSHPLPGLLFGSGRCLQQTSAELQTPKAAIGCTPRPQPLQPDMFTADASPHLLSARTAHLRRQPRFLLPWEAVYMDPGVWEGTEGVGGIMRCVRISRVRPTAKADLHAANPCEGSLPRAPMGPCHPLPKPPFAPFFPTFGLSCFAPAALCFSLAHVDPVPQGAVGFACPVPFLVLFLAPGMS